MFKPIIYDSSDQTERPLPPVCEYPLDSNLIESKIDPSPGALLYEFTGKKSNFQARTLSTEKEVSSDFRTNQVSSSTNDIFDISSFLGTNFTGPLGVQQLSPQVVPKSQTTPAWAFHYLLKEKQLYVKGCTITVCDYSKQRYRIERRNILLSAEDTYLILLIHKIIPPFWTSYEYPTTTLDYDSSDKDLATFYELADNSLIDLTSTLNKRQSWSNVRWINVNGIERKSFWALVEKYKLNSSAVDDMLSPKQIVQVNKYDNQLFITLPAMELTKERKSSSDLGSNSTSFAYYFLKLFAKIGHYYIKFSMKNKLSRYEMWRSPAFLWNRLIRFPPTINQTINSAMSRSIEYISKHTSEYSFDSQMELVKAKMPLALIGLDIMIEKPAIFILDSNTVISFFDHFGDNIENSVLWSIDFAESSSLLRVDPSPSLLVAHIIFCMAESLELIIKNYKSLLFKLKVGVLNNPILFDLQVLHLLIDDLQSVRGVIVSFIDCTTMLQREEFSDFMKNSSKPQLQKAHQYCKLFLDDLDLIIHNAENLTGLAFNCLSVGTNDYMSRLAFITMIFLPLSFWSSYYGMNFQPFNAATENDVGYYWKMALPFTVGFMLLIIWKDLLRLFEVKKNEIMTGFQMWKRKLNSV